MIKVERTFPAPQSLEIEKTKESGTYNHPDVIDQLRHDFYDKCYICGIKPVLDPEVEHRLPHKNNSIAGRKFDWNNLFWSCRHCNGVKNNVKYDAGIIDCCIRDPEKYIHFSVNEEAVEAKAFDPSDCEASLTAELVEETFNLKNTGIRKVASEARLDRLQKEMDKLSYELRKFRRKKDSHLIKRNLHILLNRKAPFAEFKRNYVRDHILDYPELKDYLK